MGVIYKQKCSRCKKNYVTMVYRQMYVTCYECQKKELEGKITDPVMKKLFKIPDELYKENSFLRSIKINYLKYGRLTDKQIEAFKKTIDKINLKAKEQKPKTEEKPMQVIGEKVKKTKKNKEKNKRVIISQ